MRRIGDKRGNRKFSDAEVLQIRREVRVDAVSQAATARKWDVSSQTIYELVTRVTYKWVTEDLDWYAIPLGKHWLQDRMDANKAKAVREHAKGYNRRKRNDTI